MLIILILISIGIFIFTIATDNEEMAFIPISVFVVKMIAIVIISWNLVECRVIDEEIDLYQTQNTEIENKVETVVKEYMQHENKTFKELKTNESYITLVTLYPELKSDKLIESEINLYEENNKKILSLKEQKINETIYKWWLYFGR